MPASRRRAARRCCAWADGSSAWPGRNRNDRPADARSRLVPDLCTRPAAAADSPELVRVGQKDEPVVRGDVVLQLFDARLEELDDPAALVADQVVVVVARAQALVPVAGLADPQPA